VRKANLTRNSNETQITIEIDLDGNGKYNIDTSIGFFNHMLELFAYYAKIDLFVLANGDVHIDGHHTVEDVGIVLGQVLKKALGDKKGIERYGSFYVPMDEALAFVSLDFSGRPYVKYSTPTMNEMVGQLQTELIEEFLRALSVHAGITLHASVLYGSNTHHMIEALFKALGKAIKMASTIVDNDIPSTKGMLD
jgi:imidazoleglycerol-phosphate dehydratase